MIIRISDLVLVVLVAALLSAGGGFWYGRHEGAAKYQAKQDSAAVKDLTTLINTTATLTADAAKASTDLRVQINRRTALDNKTTQELKNALALSAIGRAACRFDAGSMSLLEGARERANAAAASGVLSALPTAP